MTANIIGSRRPAGLRFLGWAVALMLLAGFWTQGHAAQAAEDSWAKPFVASLFGKDATPVTDWQAKLEELAKVYYLHIYGPGSLSPDDPKVWEAVTKAYKAVKRELARYPSRDPEVKKYVDWNLKGLEDGYNSWKEYTHH